MNSFLHLLLFTVVASVLFASSDTTVAAAPAGETDAEPSVVEGATKPVHDAVEPVKDTADKAKGTGGLWEMLSGKTDKKKGGLLDMLRDTRGRAKSLLPNLSGLVDGGIVPKIID